MIDDCMAGKIDMFITKSISRFARNTVDSLMNIRKLKEKNIAMFFGKENINTLGDVRQFENGVVYANHNKFLGYTKVFLGGGGKSLNPMRQSWCAGFSGCIWKGAASIKSQKSLQMRE